MISIISCCCRRCRCRCVVEWGRTQRVCETALFRVVFASNNMYAISVPPTNNTNAPVGVALCDTRHDTTTTQRIPVGTLCATAVYSPGSIRELFVHSSSVNLNLYTAVVHMYISIHSLRHAGILRRWILDIIASTAVHMYPGVARTSVTCTE